MCAALLVVSLPPLHTMPGDYACAYLTHVQLHPAPHAPPSPGTALSPPCSPRCTSSPDLDPSFTPPHTQVAILAGDFLLARASVSLASLRNPEAILLMSQSLEHLVAGEILQVLRGRQLRVCALLDVACAAVAWLKGAWARRARLFGVQHAGGHTYGACCHTCFHRPPVHAYLFACCVGVARATCQRVQDCQLPVPASGTV